MFIHENFFLRFCSTSIVSRSLHTFVLNAEHMLVTSILSVLMILLNIVGFSLSKHSRCSTVEGSISQVG